MTAAVMIERKILRNVPVLFPPCVFHKKLAAPIMHLSSPTEGISAKAITVSIQLQLMVHSEPRTSNFSGVIVKIIRFFPSSLSSPSLVKYNYSLDNRLEMKMFAGQKKKIINMNYNIQFVVLADF